MKPSENLQRAPAPSVEKIEQSLNELLTTIQALPTEQRAELKLAIIKALSSDKSLSQAELNQLLGIEPEPDAGIDLHGVTLAPRGCTGAGVLD